jgi:hypothetical protein
MLRNLEDGITILIVDLFICGNVGIPGPRTLFLGTPKDVINLKLAQ